MSAFYDLNKTPRNILNQAIVRAIVSENDGALFDPSDLSTLYQDAAGTIPVTAVEQPVGKMPDKSGNGYHATQSITASRPTLSARYNLLTSSENLTPSGGWANNSVSVIRDSTLAPDGKMTADKVILAAGASSAGNDQLGQVGNLSVASGGNPYTFSIYAKSGEVNFLRIRESINSGARVNINLTDGSFVGETGWAESIFTVKTSFVTNGFLRIEITRTAPVTFGFNIKVGGSAIGDGVSGIYMWGADLRIGTTSGPYQRVNTATDYDTDERYFPKYLRFDGVDDYLNLPYMGLYAGGSASVVMAKSADYQTDSPSFLAETSSVGAAPTYQLVGGIIQPYGLGAYIRNNAGTVVANTKSVLSADVQSAAHIVTIVDNGSLIKRFNNSSNVDSDSYARINPLTVDRTVVGAFYAGASIYNKAVMNLYGLIVTKSALTDSQRIACERYLGRKSGVQL